MAANKLYVAAVLIQLAYAGFHVISKAAFDKGMSTKSSHPLTFMISLKLFLLALLGYVLDLRKLLLVSVSMNPHVMLICFVSGSLGALTCITSV
ncbi:hypothetical protein BHM03_00041440 [Ensete ventricosum]|nr:hypothetical protein BHM03_00041440 [Ensete ventricosum]